MVGINVLFSSAIHLVMAQRLVRRLDNNSKQPYQLDPSLKENIQSVIDTFPPNVERPDLDKVTFFKPNPSPDNPFGYSGQIAIREQLQMTPHVQQLLRQSKTLITTEMLEQCAIDDGMLTMLQDGILKAAQGITSLEEIYRVVA
jgi:type II secretory ATPase GspE/PulE/Tfp pilus assembly ATPase PilB-like protein